MPTAALGAIAGKPACCRATAKARCQPARPPPQARSVLPEGLRNSVWFRVARRARRARSLLRPRRQRGSSLAAAAAIAVSLRHPAIASRRKEGMRKKFMAAVVATMLAPALLLAQKVSYDYSKSANFAAYKTYAFKDGT